MRITIDAAGRLVIPKSVRDAAGIGPGSPLEVGYRDGRIEIEPVPLEVEFIERGGVTVARAAGPIAPLTDDDVRAAQDRLRDER